MVGGEVEHLVAGRERVAVGRLFELPVALQAGLGAGQLAVVVALDVGGRPGDVPHADFIDLPVEILPGRDALAPADPEVMQAAGRRDAAAALEGMHQDTVGIGFDPAAIVDDRDLGPDVLRRNVAGVDPRPARIGVDERPADRPVAEPGDLVLSLLVHDDAAAAAAIARAGRTDPGFHGHLAAHGQAGLIADLDDIRCIARCVLRIERQRPARERYVRLDLGQNVQQVIVGNTREAFTRNELLPGMGGIGILGREQVGVELDVLHRLEQHAGIDRLDHLDHVVGELAVGRRAEPADRFGCAQDVPVAGVAQVEVEPADDGALADLGQLSGVERHVVARGNASARLVLVGVRLQHVIAGQEVAGAAAGDCVVAAVAHDDVSARAAVDAVAIGAAEQPVVAVAATDVERGQRRAGLPVAFLDAPLGIGVGELELRIRVDDVVAAAGVDDRVLDVHGLVGGRQQSVDGRARRERRKAQFGHGGVGGIGSQLEAGAVGAEPQHAAREFDDDLVRSDRRTVDQRLQVGGEVGERAVVVGRRFRQRQRDEVGCAWHL